VVAHCCESLPELTAAAAEEGFRTELLAALRRSRAGSALPVCDLFGEAMTFRA